MTVGWGRRQLTTVCHDGGSRNGGQPAAVPLLKGGLLGGRDCVPEFSDHHAAVDAPGVQHRVGPTRRPGFPRDPSAVEGQMGSHLTPPEAAQDAQLGWLYLRMRAKLCFEFLIRRPF